MKTVVLVRHAKSGWDNPEWSDFERPLNKRGLRDAPFMGYLFKEKKINPEIIFSSPANRASTTANYFVEALGIKEKEIKYDRNIYERGSKYIINLLKEVDKSVDSVLIFGHNPDITSLSSYFSGEYFDNVPTCGTVCIDFGIKSWDEIDKINGKLRFFEYPKKYNIKKLQTA